MDKPVGRSVNRSASNGKFVSTATVAKSPGGTVTEKR